MIIRGSATLPLHGGRAPRWLFEKMVRLSRAIAIIIVEEFGRKELLLKLSDPFWFQAFGCVLGFDWHSSGLTTTTMGALKEGLRGAFKELGIYICGGKGKVALRTPDEILNYCDTSGLEPEGLTYASRMAAKVDNTALQDGYSIYHHSFIFTEDGDWVVVQQGMREEDGTARRYHWLSDSMRSFVEEPHKAICAERKGKVLNFVALESSETRDFIPRYVMEESVKNIVNDIDTVLHLELPKRHYITEKDIDKKRMARLLERIKAEGIKDFEGFLSMKGVGPRTLRALGLVSELIYGNKLSFRDPARFSFAHGGKDGHPYPVDRRVYERTVSYLELILRKIRESPIEKEKALKRLLAWAGQP